jgi:hypothetical protein
MQDNNANAMVRRMITAVFLRHFFLILVLRGARQSVQRRTRMARRPNRAEAFGFQGIMRW